MTWLIVAFEDATVISNIVWFSQKFQKPSQPPGIISRKTDAVEITPERTTPNILTTAKRNATFSHTSILQEKEEEK